jgi:hypothetical protein
LALFSKSRTKHGDTISGAGGRSAAMAIDMEPWTILVPTNIINRTITNDCP